MLEKVKENYSGSTWRRSGDIDGGDFFQGGSGSGFTGSV